MKYFYNIITFFWLIYTVIAETNIAKLEDGWYFIKNPKSGKYLQISGSKDPEAIANVVIQTGTKDFGQKWKLTNIGNGLVTITTALGDYRMDVKDGENIDGANIQISHPKDEASQQFMILKTEQNDVYTIATRVSHFEKALDIEGDETEDGTNIIQWTNEMKSNQSWVFESDSSDPDEDNEKDSCWSEPLGYPCCSDCQESLYEDEDGKWGIENDDWCGISTSC